MKIQDLLEQFEAHHEKVKSKNKFKKVFDKPSNENKISSTSGAFGRVYSTGNPHTLIKRPHGAINPKSDGYYQYASMIIKNDLAQSNPYFPRFYNIKEVKDKSGRILYRAEVERLMRHDQVGDEILESLINNLFSSKIIEDYKENHMGFTLASMLSDLVEKCMISGKGFSKDEHLNAATKIIHQFVEKNHRGYDLHSDNLMYRLSPYPQIVIVDPFL